MSTALVLRADTDRVRHTNNVVWIARDAAVMPAPVPTIGGGGGFFGLRDVSPGNRIVFGLCRTAAGTVLCVELYSSLHAARRQCTVVGRFAADIQQVRHLLADFGRDIVTGSFCTILAIAAIHRLRRRAIISAAHRNGSSVVGVGPSDTGSRPHNERRGTIHGGAAT